MGVEEEKDDEEEGKVGGESGWEHWLRMVGVGVFGRMGFGDLGGVAVGRW